MSYKEAGKWWVSPGDFSDDVTKDFHFPEQIEILDTTLRDGESRMPCNFGRRCRGAA